LIQEEYRPEIFNTRTGAKLKELPTSSDRVAMSSDGRLVLAAGKVEFGWPQGASQKVELWDVAAGQKLREFDAPPFLGYAASICDLGFSNDGRYVFAGRGDGTTPFW
jgi:WD40 repeat protein